MNSTGAGGFAKARYVPVEAAPSFLASESTTRLPLLPEEIERLRLLSLATQSGRTISHVASLDTEDLARMVREDEEARGAAREAAQELLSEVGLSVAQDATPGELDRAAQRRVALARALALRPPVLLLDEPTQGLDAHAASELDRTLRELQERGGFGVVIFTREARYAFGNAQRVYVMAEGRVVDAGDHDSLADSEHPVVRGLLRRRGSE
mgnify:CR=1 FL=1